MKNYLDFEKDIKTLEEDIEKLKDPFNKEGISEVNTEKIHQLQNIHRPKYFNYMRRPLRTLQPT